jgi:hypothetical protein
MVRQAALCPCTCASAAAVVLVGHIRRDMRRHIPFRHPQGFAGCSPDVVSMPDPSAAPDCRPKAAAKLHKTRNQPGVPQSLRSGV